MLYIYMYIYQLKANIPTNIATCNILVMMVCSCRLVETHIFSFVVGRAFVTDIEKLKISSKTRSLDVEHVLKFFSEVMQVCLVDSCTKS